MAKFMHDHKIDRNTDTHLNLDVMDIDMMDMDSMDMDTMDMDTMDIDTDMNN
jgi:hypothetical protein